MNNSMPTHLSRLDHGRSSSLGLPNILGRATRSTKPSLRQNFAEVCGEHSIAMHDAPCVKSILIK